MMHALLLEGCSTNAAPPGLLVGGLYCTASRVQRGMPTHGQPPDPCGSMVRAYCTSNCKCSAVGLQDHMNRSHNRKQQQEEDSIARRKAAPGPYRSRTANFVVHYY